MKGCGREPSNRGAVALHRIRRVRAPVCVEAMAETLGIILLLVALFLGLEWWLESRGR